MTKCILARCKDLRDCTGRCVAENLEDTRRTFARIDPHYVCCHATGVPAQIGPLSEGRAHEVQTLIRRGELGKAFSQYNTWIDWRILPGRVVIDLDGLGPEAAQPTTSPTLPLGHLCDRILIAELKRRGYDIPKKNACRKFNQAENFSSAEFDGMRALPTWMESVKLGLAARLGKALYLAGGITFDEWPEENSRTLRASVWTVTRAGDSHGG